MRLLLPVALLSATNSACSSMQAESDRAARRPAAGSTSEIVLISDVEWGPLNPARGDKGPRAGTLWGNRTGPGPSGFLVEFSDGFESPPHIHNLSYRGSVISGLVHNDDPDAEEIWMPAGSFWTQPRGAVHITAAKGSRNLAYIEIEEGPYLVLPVDEEFPTEEFSINVDASNLVWIDPPGGSVFVPGPKLAHLWGSVQEGELNGTFLKFPAGFTGTVRSPGATFRAVVIQGLPRYRLQAETETKAMEPGSSFGSEGNATHRISCGPEAGCIMYVRTEGSYEVVSAQAPD